jgi:hypothetical protein
LTLGDIHTPYQHRPFGCFPCACSHKPPNCFFENKTERGRAREEREKIKRRRGREEEGGRRKMRQKTAPLNGQSGACAYEYELELAHFCFLHTIQREAALDIGKQL